MQYSTVGTNKGLVLKCKKKKKWTTLWSRFFRLKSTCYLTVSSPVLSVHILFTEVHESFPFHLSPSAATNPPNKNSFLFNRERTSPLSFPACQHLWLCIHIRWKVFVRWIKAPLSLTWNIFMSIECSY